MYKNLEDDLTRTLAAAANAAPEPGPHFETQVAGRRRRRRRVRIGGMAGLSVVFAATLAVPVGASLIRSDPRPAQTAQPSMHTIDLRTARPAQEVWPEAVARVPAALPGGLSLDVVARLDEDRFVVVPGGGPTGYSFPVIYNTRTRQVATLMTGTAPPGITGFGYGGVWVSQGQIMWVAAARVGGDAKHGYYEVWTAPTSGGPSVRRAVFDHPGDVAIVSPLGTTDTIYVSVHSVLREGDAQIYKVPEGGGAPLLVPGSEGYVWFPSSTGPWAYKRPPARQTEDLATPAADPAPTYWNIETGERRAPRQVAEVTDVRCTPEICLGSYMDGLMAYRFDGSSLDRVIGGPPNGDPTRLPPVIEGSGRFIELRWQNAKFLVDLKNHTAATLPSEFLGASYVPEQTITLSRAGSEQVLLDMTRIP